MLTLEAVDPSDEPAFRRWFSVLVAVQPVDEPHRPPPVFDAVRGDIPPPDDAFDRWHHLVALVGDEAVGAAQVQVTTDSPGLAFFRLMVRPDQRRRGIGSALLAAVESWSVAAGRTVALTETMQPASAPVIPGVGFAQRHGYRRGVVSVYRELEVPVSAARLAELDPGPVTGYRVVTWTDRCPSELLASRAALNVEMSTDDPAAGPHREAEVWDEARVRMYEDRNISHGRQRLCSGAVYEETGELVAVTWIIRDCAPHVHQLGTVVARKHRGQRLGMLVKVANLRQLASAWPDVRRVSSWNGGSNASMIAINEALGYRVAGDGADWEKDLLRS